MSSGSEAGHGALARVGDLASWHWAQASAPGTTSSIHRDIGLHAEGTSSPLRCPCPLMSEPRMNLATFLVPLWFLMWPCLGQQKWLLRALFRHPRQPFVPRTPALPVPATPSWLLPQTALLRLSRSGSNTDMSLQLVFLPLPQPALPFLQCDVLCPWRGRQESRSAGLASSGDAFSWMRGHVS